MHILILGAGAIGGYFGGRLAASHDDVTFLVRQNRARQLAEGLRIESPLGNATVDVQTITAGEPAAPFDIVLLACKAFGLDDALDAVSPHVRENTVLLPLLNGFQHLEKVENRFPEGTVWGCVVQCPATLAADGTIRHLGTQHGLIVGTRAGQEASQARAADFVTVAVKAGIDARVSNSVEQDMWDKWVFLAALAAGTCVTQCNVGEILASDQGEGLLQGLLDECTAVAAKEGFRPDDERMEMYRGLLTDTSSDMAASMMRDMQQGNPIEADHIVGSLVRLARSHGLPTPRLDTVWTCLHCYQTRRNHSCT